MAEADLFVRAKNLSQATKILTDITRTPKQYTPETLKPVYSKIGEIDKLFAKNEIARLISEAERNIEETELSKSSSALSSLDAKLKNDRSLYDEFSGTLSTLHFNCANKYSYTHFKMMENHLKQSQSYGNETAKSFLTIYNGGQGTNPFTQKYVGRVPSTYDLRGNPR